MRSRLRRKERVPPTRYVAPVRSARVTVSGPRAWNERSGLCTRSSRNLGAERRCRSRPSSWRVIPRPWPATPHWASSSRFTVITTSITPPFRSIASCHSSRAPARYSRRVAFRWPDFALRTCVGTTRRCERSPRTASCTTAARRCTYRSAHCSKAMPTDAVSTSAVRSRPTTTSSCRGRRTGFSAFRTCFRMTSRSSIGSR